MQPAGLLFPVAQRLGARCAIVNADPTLFDDRADAVIRRSRDPNAFVERYQGTVLHLHYRATFRYRFYTQMKSTTTSRPVGLLQPRATPPRGTF